MYKINSDKTLELQWREVWGEKKLIIDKYSNVIVRISAIKDMSINTDNFFLVEGLLIILFNENLTWGYGRHDKNQGGGSQMDYHIIMNENQGNWIINAGTFSGTTLGDDEILSTAEGKTWGFESDPCKNTLDINEAKEYFQLVDNIKNYFLDYGEYEPSDEEIEITNNRLWIHTSRLKNIKPDGEGQYYIQLTALSPKIKNMDIENISEMIPGNMKFTF